MRFIAILVLAAGVRALSAAPPPAELFYKPGEIRDAVISPDGESLAVTTSLGSTHASLVMVDLRGGAKPVRIAEFNDADVRAVTWVNNRRLVFSLGHPANDPSPGGGGPGLFAVNRDGSEPRRLIQRITYTFVDGNSRDTALSAMHSLLEVPRLREGQANNEVLIAEWSTSGKPGLSTWWLNVDTGRKRGSGHRVPEGTAQLLTDSAGEPRVALSRVDNRVQAWWRGPDEAAWRPLVEGDTLRGPAFQPHAVDDSGTLYVTRTQPGPAAEIALYRFDFERKAPEPEPLVRTPGFDFSGRLLMEAGGGRAQGVRLVTDAETTIWFDAQLKRLQALADARFPGRINAIGCWRCGEPDALMAVRSYSDRDPGSLWLYRAQPAAGQSEWMLLLRARSELDPSQQASVSFERIKARDGRDLPLWLTQPPGTVKGQPRPTVVLVHGGPWVRGGRWAWQPMQQFLASRGYLVIEPEFRGSTGYGRAHFRAGWKQWGQAMQDDVADALRWAQAQGLADPHKVCIAGASYGGYSTLMGLIKHPDLYRCGVAWVAVADMSLFLEGSWFVQDDISAVGRRVQLPAMVGDPTKDADMLAANNPVLHADKIKAPLLLAMGELDQRVPLAHGKRMREALEKAGNPPEWVVYEGEGHGWYLTQHKVDFANRVEAFLARHLGDKK